MRPSSRQCSTAAIERASERASEREARAAREHDQTYDVGVAELVQPARDHGLCRVGNEAFVDVAAVQVPRVPACRRGERQPQGYESTSARGRGLDDAPICGVRARPLSSADTRQPPHSANTTAATNNTTRRAISSLFSLGQWVSEPVRAEIGCARGSEGSERMACWLAVPQRRLVVVVVARCLARRHTPRALVVGPASFTASVPQAAPSIRSVSHSYPPLSKY